MGYLLQRGTGGAHVLPVGAPQAVASVGVRDEGNHLFDSDLTRTARPTASCLRCHILSMCTPDGDLVLSTVGVKGENLGVETLPAQNLNRVPTQIT